MEKKPQNPLVKLALELGPIMVFFLAYRWANVPEGGTKEEHQLAQLLFATKVFIPVTVLSVFAGWLMTRMVPRMPLVSAVIVVVMGGLTLWLKDDTFVKMKPTILYTMFAAILGYGLMRGKSYLQYVMEDSMPLSDEGWTIFTRRFALFFLSLAVLNELVWRNFDTDAWVNFKTFLLPVATFGFFFSQMGMFNKHMIVEPAEKAGDEE